MTKQFLRWAGSKRKLVDRILPLLGTNDDRTYYEPFLGSGAVFFALVPSRSVLSDSNADLVAGYQTLRDQPDRLFDSLKQHQNNHNLDAAKYYLEVRAIGNIPVGEELSDSDRLLYASRFLYLNRACFNGLWRVNQKGIFNAAIGSDRNGGKAIEFEWGVLRDCSIALQRSEIRHSNYSEIIRSVEAGDRLYCDPPYLPIVQQTNFKSYNKNLFTIEDQASLAKECLRASARGACVVLSNSDTIDAHKLYEGARDLIPVEVIRSISAKASKRKVAKELLVKF